MTTWSVDRTRILSRAEIAAVLADLKRLGRRSVNARMNLALFRLTTCCGLRATEAATLRAGDVRCTVARPYLNLPRSATKGHRARRVPLWWDAGTLHDLEAWRAERIAQGAGAADPFLCTLSKGSEGNQLDRRHVRSRFRRACKVLGPERLQSLTTHDGRHTFISHALAGGRTLAEVRDAAGHASIATTSVYTHVAVDDDGEIGELFG